MNPLVTSLLDTDLYKFTMWHAQLHRHPQTQSEYRFGCRNTPAYPLAELLPQVNAALDHLCSLCFTQGELACVGGLRYLQSDFVDFLRIFQFQRSFISAWAEGEQLHIMARGPQVHGMGFEIFMLAIVNELYFCRFDVAHALASGRTRQAAKVQQLQTLAQQATLRHPFELFELFDFGLRRRYSGAWQREVVETLPPKRRSSSRARATCCWRATWTWCPSAPWRTNTGRPTRRWAYGCATFKRPRSKTGCRNTGATWALR